MTNDTNLQLATNELVNLFRQRLLTGGLGLDAKRPRAWREYGWPEHVTNDDLAKLYRRNAVAHGLIERIAGTIWSSDPEIIEGSERDEATKVTAWEQSLKKSLPRNFWRQVAIADKMRLAGRFSGLILQIRDSKSLDKPVRDKGRQLVNVIPVWGSSLRVLKYDEKLSSDNYGKPILWEYMEYGTGTTAIKRTTIHADRLFIFGDYNQDAIGFLEPAFNAFVNLEKVEGGSGESFLKNAARQMAVKFEKDVNFVDMAKAKGLKPDELKESFQKALRDINMGIDSMLVLQGGEATPMVAPVYDPMPTYMMNINSIAAETQTPSKIIVGMQTGERASTEDQKDFLAVNQARRNDRCFELEDLFLHIMRLGLVAPVPEFTVLWDDLRESTKQDKLANAKLMSDINNVAVATGQVVFSVDEIRTEAGFEVDSIDPLGEVDGEVADPTE